MRWMGGTGRGWRLAAAAVTALGLAGLLAHLPPPGTPADVGLIATGPDGGRDLHAAYQRWKSRSLGGATAMFLPLAHSKGLSAGFTPARGRVTIDPVRGDVTVAVSGLPTRDALDVWLVDNQPGPGRTVRAEPGDTFVRLGRLLPVDGHGTLQARLDRRALGELEIDLVVVTAAGQSPAKGALLVAVPALFQRLYLAEQRGHLARLGGGAALGRPDQARDLLRSLAAVSLILPGPAVADEPLDLATRLDLLVARGEHVFFNERFGGNGRTCGTCHPAQNNFTIDPAFIATLPPTDPLFVAEVPGSPLARNFEKPDLMRRFGLILLNTDGFEDLEQKFIMRSVPHLLALSTSMAPVMTGQDGTTTPPHERLGWGGDGAPGSGTLREFAIGAVRQHFPRRPERAERLDFRLPTDEELDALEAFQRSLGRQEDIDLNALALRGALAALGQRLFMNEGKCNRCHVNAGATSSFAPGNVNFNINTGVEEFTHRILGRTTPRDGGFGVTPDGRGGHGNGTFNVPPLIEAADTAPFFHSNAFETLEGVVDFYGRQDFNDSPGQALVDGVFFTSEIFPQSIGAFLRVLNALENIRSATALAEAALRPTWYRRPAATLRRAHGELGDAIRVLSGVGLHPEVVQVLQRAQASLARAIAATGLRARQALVQAAMNDQAAARGLLVVE